jgi:hypothetical protein
MNPVDSMNPAAVAVSLAAKTGSAETVLEKPVHQPGAPVGDKPNALRGKS